MQKLKITYKAGRKEKECPCQVFRLTIIMKGGKQYTGIKTAPDRKTFCEAVQKWLNKWEQYPNVSGWRFKAL